MNSFPRFLFSLGLTLIVIALLWHFGGRYFHFGRLPGDISINRPGYRVTFPIATCILISLILSFFNFLFRYFQK